MIDRDRTIHAIRNDGTEIVRYDRAGKWWAEPTINHPRFPLPTVRDAAEYAAEDLYVHFADLPGGSRFDALLEGKLK